MFELILRAMSYIAIFICVLGLSVWVVGLVVDPPLWTTGLLGAMLAANFVAAWRQDRAKPKVTTQT